MRTAVQMPAAHFRLVEPGDKDRKFVAAKARHRAIACFVGPRNDLVDGAGNSADDGVADIVAVPIVDRLEAVDVDHHRGDRLRLGFGAGKNPPRALEKGAAVGQAGKRIGARQPLELGAHLPKLMVRAHQRHRPDRRGDCR